ncbi:MAG: SH3 domain-containing protein [Betaproteobacteria bacterium]
MGRRIGRVRWHWALFLIMAFGQLEKGGALAMAASFMSATDPATVLYDAPSLKAKKRFIVNQGYPLEVQVQTKGWFKVRDQTRALSWVQSKQVSNTPRMVMVKVPLANVRQSAEDNAAVRFQVAQNVLLELTESLPGGWFHVQHRDGSTGYLRTTQVWGG